MEAPKIDFKPNVLKTYIDPDKENEPKRGMLITDFIQSMTIRKSKTNSYKALYNGLAKKITAFQVEFDCRIFTNSVTEEFMEDFIAWLTDQQLRPNTVKGFVERLKAIVRKAGNYGYSINRTFDDACVTGEDSPAIALSMNEITRIYYFRGLTKKQEAIKDMFVVGCLTGLRFSDYSTLRKDNIVNGIIIKKTQKTGAIVHIPIHKYVWEILTKYDGFPPQKNIQHFNRYLKVICQQIGFCDEITNLRVVGGHPVMETHKKYELISSHTARRSFATNMYHSHRFSTVQIMSITGHSSEKSFLKYIKLNKEDSARAIASDLFFNQ